jgi:CheY-like chemotaxis protein
VALPTGSGTGEGDPGRTPLPFDDLAGADERSTRAGPATLLYIEDNEPNVHVVEHLLRLRPGWRMIHAALGGLGVELARAHHPDLVLLDLHLPDQDGTDVLRVLKRRDDTKGIPVVILSADASPGLSRKLVHAGAERFITKPLDFDVVLGLLDDVARRRGSADAHAEGKGADD